MLFELKIIPLGESAHTSSRLAEVVKLVEASGLPYELTPTATCIEGSWNDVMALIKKCHDQARRMSSHVLTSVTVEDDADSENKLVRNVSSIEEKMDQEKPLEVDDRQMLVKN
jgi:uncharacterized protein (TIGR00106 family)